MILRGRRVSGKPASISVRRVSTHLPPSFRRPSGRRSVDGGDATGSWGSDASSRGGEVVFGSPTYLEAPRRSSDRRGVEELGEGSHEGPGGAPRCDVAPFGVWRSAAGRQRFLRRRGAVSRRSTSVPFGARWPAGSLRLSSSELALGLEVVKRFHGGASAGSRQLGDELFGAPRRAGSGRSSSSERGRSPEAERVLPRRCGRQLALAGC